MATTGRPRGRPPKRIEQTRDATSRKATARRMPQTAHQGRLWIDPSRVPSGMEYGWIRSHLLNEPDEGNMQTRLMDAWRPVPADRHPEWGGNFQEMSQIFGTASEAPTIIKFKGLVLCECPAHVLKQRRQARQEQNFLAMNSLPGLDAIEGAPTINESGPVMAERVRTDGPMDDGPIKQD